MKEIPTCPGGGRPLRFFPSLTHAILLIALVSLFPPLGAPLALADDDSLSCDSLESVTPQEGTVWTWFSHPCPPAPGEANAVILPGVGVTLQGFWIPPTLDNPTGTPVSPGRPLLQSLVDTGYGGGLEITGWFTPNLALRFQADLWTFPPQSAQEAFTMLPVLLGVEVRILGSNRVYLYVAGDGGVALDGQKVANAFVGTGASPYAQLAVGLNVFAVQIEAGYGVLFDPYAKSPTGSPSGSANPFFLFPLSVGFHL